MYKVVLLRHGESVWNKENLFTGWTDVDLSEKGRHEACKAALMLKKQGYTFGIAFTSLLKRAIRTLWILLDEMDLMWIPVQRDWRLNERHYGSFASFVLQHPSNDDPVPDRCGPFLHHAGSRRHFR